MNFISSLIGWIFDPADVNTQNRDELFLAESVDICDHERRMRLLDQRRPFGPFGQNG